MQLLQYTSRVVIIPLGLQSSQNGLSLDDLELHALDLVVKEAVQRHDERGATAKVERRKEQEGMDAQCLCETLL
jgi:hypothetical protein